MTSMQPGITTVPPSRSRFIRSEAGFAIMVALGLMAFIFLLLVILSTLTQVELATTKTRGDMVAARENALYGLHVALGELQKHTGPDRRITATASIFANNAAAVEQPHWVGVWDSEAWDPDNPATLPNANTLFRRWLVSVPLGDDPESQALPGAIAIDNNWVQMVGSGTLGATALNQDYVYAGKASLDDEGYYAFWVGDEGVKARFNQPELADYYTSLPAQSFALAAPERWRIEAVDNDANPNTASPFATYFDPTHPRLADITSEAEVGLMAAGQASQELWSTAFRERFHDLSLSSVGLLTNARDGGLKQDLSLAFEMDENLFDGHVDFAAGSGGPLSLYTTNNPDGQPVKHLWFHESLDDAVPDGMGHYKGPTWHLLRDYYNLYREVTTPTTTPTLAARISLPLPERLSNNLSIPKLYDNGQDVYNSGQSSRTGGGKPLLRPRTLKVAPVVARVQLVLSVRAVPIDQSTIVHPTPDPGNQYYMLQMILDPIVTLYNPYTVNIWFQGVTVHVGNVISALQWELNGDKSNLLTLEEIFYVSHPEFIPTSPAWNQHIKRGIAKMFIGKEDGITMAPGELLVYSPGNDSPEALDADVDAEPGWPASGGFFVNTLDPDPRIRDPNWDSSDSYKKDYKGHELDGGITGILIGAGSDQISFDFEIGGVTPRIVSTFSAFSAQSQMIVDAYLVAPGSYPDRFETDQTFVADQLQHYTRLRSTLSFGEDTLTDNIGRRPENGTYTFSGLSGDKQTLAQIDMRLKTEDDTTRPYPMFGLSSMSAFTTNPQSAAGTDYGVINPPYAVVRKPLLDVTDSELTQFDVDYFRGFWGPTREFSSSATSFVAGTDIPKAPLVSLGQLQHLDTAIYGYEPSHAIGNAFASPWISLNAIERGDRANIDISFLSNNALWDGYYFSTITPQDAAVFSPNVRTIGQVVDQFTGENLPVGVTATVPLPNPRLEYLSGSPTALRDAILENNGSIRSDAHRKSAAHLGVKGAFNVNSTSEEAWKTLFSSLGSGRLAQLNDSGNFVNGASTIDNRISRFSTPLGDPEDKWEGYSALTDREIADLARETVDQVRQRGPFFSMAQFVNRQISADPVLAKAGALQTAINNAGINDDSRNIIEFEITGNYIEDIAATVPTDTGAAGFLTQADLLSQLAPFLSVRSDTFTIRAYGETIDPLTGQPTARAWCEAIVQRVPDYLEPGTDAADAAPYDQNGNPALNSAVNQAFGRQYKVIAFHWLNEDEV